MLQLWPLWLFLVHTEAHQALAAPYAGPAQLHLSFISVLGGSSTGQVGPTKALWCCKGPCCSSNSPRFVTSETDLDIGQILERPNAHEHRGRKTWQSSRSQSAPASKIILCSVAGANRAALAQALGILGLLCDTHLSSSQKLPSEDIDCGQKDGPFCRLLL